MSQNMRNIYNDDLARDALSLARSFSQAAPSIFRAARQTNSIKGFCVRNQPE